MAVVGYDLAPKGETFSAHVVSHQLDGRMCVWACV